MKILFVVLTLLAALVAFLVMRPPAVTDNFSYDQPPPFFLFQILTGLSKLLRCAADALTPPAIRSFDIGFGVHRGLTAYTCMRTGVLELLSRDGTAQSVSALAAKTKIDPLLLRRVLRACATIGVVRDVTPATISSSNDVHELAREYQLAPLGDSLRADHPFSTGPMIGHLVEDILPALPLLESYLRNSTELPFIKAHNSRELPLENSPHGIWHYFKSKPAQDAQFNKAMSSLDGLGVGALMQDYAWGQNCATIVDVGGGKGSLLSYLLKVAPEARGILFDLPQVIEQAKAAPFLPPLGERATFVAGSFFDAKAVPRVSHPGPACYISKVVLHDWSDAHVTQIVNNLAAAMRKGDKKILIEAIPDTPELSPELMMIDMNMMLIGGMERTLNEYRHLFEAAGLQFVSLHRTRSLFKVAVFEKK